jgi:hypothetical protein
MKENNFTVFYYFSFKLFHNGHTTVFYTINYHYMLDIPYSYHMMSETTSTSTVDFCCAMVVNDGYVLAMNVWPITKAQSSLAVLRHKRFLIFDRSTVDSSWQ